MDVLSSLSKFESNLPVSICMGILHHVSGFTQSLRRLLYKDTYDYLHMKDFCHARNFTEQSATSACSSGTSAY